MIKYEIIRVKRPEDFTREMKDFLLSEVPKIAERFDNVFDYTTCSPFTIASESIFLFCLREGRVTGIMIASLGQSIFDHKIKILRQQLFYVKPHSGRTAHVLFQKFIDIGNRYANHIITMLTRETNIKPQTLESMGFKEMETLYRMEISK